MRAIKAKQLRNMVKKTFPGLPTINYTTKQKVKKLLTGELNKDGTRKEIVVVRETLLLKDCQREVYQGLKRVA